jgi:hypothetical protein
VFIIATLISAATIMTDDDTSKAKESLKRTLLDNHGDLSHPSALEAISTLQSSFLKQQQQLRGEPDAYDVDCTKDPMKHEGKWRMISAPSFPGRLSPNNDDPHGGNTEVRYTLGRMAFNMFKPTKIVCCIDEIVNVVEPLEFNADAVPTNGYNKEEGGAGNCNSWERSYNNEVMMKIELPVPDLKQANDDDTSSSTIQVPAKLVNYGICTPISSTRLSVKFTGGILKPNFDMNSIQNQQYALAWKQTFEGAISKENDTASFYDRLKSGMNGVFMKWMMGLIPPVDDESLTQTYRIERPISGYLDILYMNDDLRISRGNRGTVVVVERV